jgi:hypothetical protein
MTTGLLIGALIIVGLMAAGIALLQRAKAEPAARAAERAPDPAEEREAEATSSRGPGILVDRGHD